MTNDEVRELGALYALGALDEASSQDLEAMLETLPDDLRQEILGWREVVGLLPLSLEPVHIPPRVRQRLLNETAATVSASAEARSVTRTRRTALESTIRYGLIAASIVLGLTAILLYRSNQSLKTQIAALSRSLDTSTTALAAERRRRDEVIASATRMVSLKGGAAAPSASARLFWDTERQEWVIYFFNLPAIPSDREYQLWYITQDQRKVSARVFREDTKGRVELRIVVPREIAPTLAATAVTLEPRGGSSQPTGQLVLQGAI